MSRAEFDAWYRAQGWPGADNPHHGGVAMAWEGWQAATERAASIAEGFDSCDPKYIAAAIRGASQG